MSLIRVWLQQLHCHPMITFARYVTPPTLFILETCTDQPKRSWQHQTFKKSLLSSLLKNLEIKVRARKYYPAGSGDSRQKGSLSTLQLNRHLHPARLRVLKTFSRWSARNFIGKTCLALECFHCFGKISKRSIR